MKLLHPFLDCYRTLFNNAINQLIYLLYNQGVEESAKWTWERIS